MNENAVETFSPLFHEIFAKVNNAKDKPKKVAVLQTVPIGGFRKLFNGRF